MRKTYRLIFFLFLLAGASFLGLKNTSQVLSFFHSQKQLVTASANEGNQKQISENYGKSPLSFVSNEGQFDSKVAYASRGAGYSIFLTQTEAVLALNKSGSQRTDEQSVIKMQLADVNSTPSLTALEQLPGKVNYFSGSDKTKWQANVPTYAKVQYQNVYKGIDLVYYGNQRQLEYDFIVSPGANPRDIALTYDGAEKAEVNTDGALVLSLDGKEVQMHKPLVYQEVDGVKVEIQGNYLLASDNRVNFQVGVYDTTKPLVIDPVLSYSTYLGGSGGDDAFDFFVDSNGNAFITGRTGSTNFPTVDAQQASYNGGEDVFVTKLDTNGAIAYSTYLGGSGGENAVTIVTDSNGNAYVGGYTNSTDFPTQNAPFPTYTGGGTDGFITKLNDTGAIDYSTYLGGSLGASVSYKGLAVDSNNNLYVGGDTSSSDFPLVNASQSTYGGNHDAFLTKFDSGGNVLFSTYLGGSDSEGSPNVLTDSTNSVYIVGGTNSSDFPTSNASQSSYGGSTDLFITKYNSSGNVLYSTYLGGSDEDGLYSAGGVILDSNDDLIVGGATGPNFPISNAAQPTYGGNGDGFVTKFNSSGAIQFSTFLGGSDGDAAIYLTHDTSNNIIVGSGTSSSDFPLLNAARSTFGGNSEGVVTKYNSSGSVVFSTYVGGSGEDGLYDVATDSYGNVYTIGYTSSTDFAVLNAIQSTYGGGNVDAFIQELTSTGAMSFSTYLGGASDDIAGTDGSGMGVDANNNVYIVGGTSSNNFPVVNAAQPTFGGGGDVFIAKIAADINLPPTVDAGGPYQVNEGGSVQVSATGNDPENGNLTYAWDLDNNGSFETPGQTVTFSAAGLDGPSSRTIAVQVTDNGGLTATSQATVNVLNVAPTVGTITAPTTPVQVNTAISASAYFTDPGVLDTHTASWNWGDGTTAGTVTETNGSGSVSGSHTYTVAGVYTLTLTVTDKDGGVGTSEPYMYVVVYDPSAGYVTGAGTITSPLGAYTLNPALTGKANFGFVSRYQNGATVPTGQTQFRFAVANFTFQSTSYDWLVVGGPKAQYKGSGTINGNGDYGFILTAIDGAISGGGGTDKFRLKVYDKTTNVAVYDNQTGASDTTDPTTVIDSGSIMIHH